MKNVLRSVILFASLVFMGNSTPSKSAPDHPGNVYPNTPCEEIADLETNAIITNDQNAWGGTMSSAAVTLLFNGFSTVYPSGLVVGTISKSITFSMIGRLYLFLPNQSGSPGVLNMAYVNPDNSSAGPFAADVIALKLNVDFSDAGLLGNGDIKFGDLFICGTGEPGLDGLTVRQFLAIANEILGGDPTPMFSVGTASAVAGLLNTAFSGGTPSQFALDHLRICPCPPPPCEDITVWQAGDIIAYSQGEWDDDVDGILTNNFSTLFGASLGVEIGILGDAGYSIKLTSATRIKDYLPSIGTAVALSSDLLNPTASQSGTLGGEVLALLLNIAYSDAGFLTGNLNIPIGDLILYDLTSSQAVFNGLSVRELLDIAYTLLGGGNNGYVISDVVIIAAEINGGFHSSGVSSYVQQHLKFVCPPPPCEDITVWQGGQMLAYNQQGWGDASSTAGSLLSSEFGTLYGSSLVIGGPNTITFTNANAIFTFLPTSGTSSALTGSLQNPQTSSAGELAGQVLALQLNVDFSDSHLIEGVVPFGDLILHDITTIPQVNGWSVREVLAIGNTILGAGTATIPYSGEFVDLITDLNNSFRNGTPSQFAQEHLKRGWRQGDMYSRTQGTWDADNSWYTDYDDIYSPTGILEVGIPGSAGYSIRFTGADAISDFFEQTGTPAILNADLIDPTLSSSRGFGGETVALKLNVEFSDFNKFTVNTSYRFGDLVINNIISNPEFNGMSIRELLANANILLGGGSASVPYSEFIVELIIRINGAFVLGTPNSWAQEHLSPPCIQCPTSTDWKENDLYTLMQRDWDGSRPWFLDYNDIYASASGLLEIGLPGNSGYSLRFTGPDRVAEYFVQVGLPNTFNADLIDATGSSSNGFGGEMVSLTLNVDFSDFNRMPITNQYRLGDLILYNLTTLSQLNGMSVREILSVADTVIGTGQSFIVATNTSNLEALTDLIAELNLSFHLGTPSQFALDHLKLPCGETNHCPIATSASVTTKVGTAINIQLQATDEDDDVLSYSISQNPLHGTVTTSASGAATYTPTAGYYGADEFKFKASDGECDDEEMVTVTIVKCPEGKGYWTNNPGSWPASATPMMLGTISYTKAQLLTILKTPIGTGNKADASLMLAHQEIAAKLNLANGSPAAANLNQSLAAADALIGNNAIPMRIKPNTALGQSMIALANFFASYNNGLLTEACHEEPALTSSKQTTIMQEASEQDQAGELKIKAYPNPTANSFSLNIRSNSNERTMMQVIDMYGRIIETKNVTANSMIRFGDRYRPGVYFVRIMQGKEHKEIKLVKISD